MKKNILIVVVILCGILLATKGQAQREIQFSYDDAGNMTSRVIFMPQSVPASIEQQNDPVIPNQYDDMTYPDNTDNEDTTEQPDDKDVNKEESYTDQLGTTQISIYPNPTKGKLVIDIPYYQGNSNDRIDIVDMQGKLKQRVSPISSSNTIYIDNYPAATYLMLIHIGDETTQWKIIKQ